MTTRTTHNPLRAATADRLERMFRRGEAYADECDDIARAIESLVGRYEHVRQLTNVLDRLYWVEGDESIELKHEERVALYVASKVVGR